MIVAPRKTNIDQECFNVLKFDYKYRDSALSRPAFWRTGRSEILGREECLEARLQTKSCQILQRREINIDRQVHEIGS